MNSSLARHFAFAALLLAGLPSFSRAALIADLRTDYTEVGMTTDGQAQPSTPGTVSGFWYYYSDTDGNPNNGGLVGLTFDTSTGLEGGDGFSGTGTVFGNPGCCGNFPLISDEGLFDGVTVLPAGVVAIHPGQTGGGSLPPEYSVIEYEATEDLIDAALSYSINNPAAGGDGIDWQIIDKDGNVLASGAQDGNASAGTIALGDILLGDSFFFVTGNGAGNDPAGDQAFLGLQISGTVVPEPASVAIWGLLSAGLAFFVARRRRNRRKKSCELFRLR